MATPASTPPGLGRVERWVGAHSRQCWGALTGFLLLGTAAGCLVPGDSAVAGGAVLVGLGYGWLVGDRMPRRSPEFRYLPDDLDRPPAAV